VFVLGRVHGDVGVAQQFRDARRAPGRSGDADAGLDVDRPAGHYEGPAQRRDDLLGDGARRVPGPVPAGDREQGELVSTQPAKESSGGHRRP
jgi:hypothetical protein